MSCDLFLGSLSALSAMQPAGCRACEFGCCDGRFCCLTTTPPSTNRHNKIPVAAAANPESTPTTTASKPTTLQLQSPTTPSDRRLRDSVRPCSVRPTTPRLRDSVTPTTPSDRRLRDAVRPTTPRPRQTDDSATPSELDVVGQTPTTVQLQRQPTPEEWVIVVEAELQDDGWAFIRPHERYLEACSK